MIRKIARSILDALDCPDAELSLVLTDDAGITPINREYLARDRSTNVIAFPMREGSFGDITPGLLGDVIISLETADTESRHAGIPLTVRFAQLLVHGILHLFNYDHEKSARDAAIMDAKSAEMMTAIEKEGPLSSDFIRPEKSPAPTQTAGVSGQNA